MPNTKAKAKNSRAITTTTITTIVTTTVTSPKPPAKRGLATNAKTIRPSATSASGPSTDKRQRRFISLSLKADFIKDVLAEQELDPRFPAASVGRRQKYNFTRAEISRMIRDADDTPRKVQEASHRNPVKISRIYPRKMEVIEKVLYSQLKNEIDSNIPVNDSRLREMALQTYVEMMPLLDPDMAPELIDFSDDWLKDALNLCRAVSSYRKRDVVLSTGVQPAQSLSRSIAVIVRDGLDLLSNAMVLEEGLDWQGTVEVSDTEPEEKQ